MKAWAAIRVRCAAIRRRSMFVKKSIEIKLKPAFVNKQDFVVSHDNRGADRAANDGALDYINPPMPSSSAR
ncbi:MAG: hypothetical protein ACR2P7_06220 [bacterium]